MLINKSSSGLHIFLLILLILLPVLTYYLYKLNILYDNIYIKFASVMVYLILIFLFIPARLFYKEPSKHIHNAIIFTVGFLLINIGNILKYNFNKQIKLKHKKYLLEELLIFFIYLVILCLLNISRVLTF